jgi:hypothetical protein
MNSSFSSIAYLALMLPIFMARIFAEASLFIRIDAVKVRNLGFFHALSGARLSALG